MEASLDEDDSCISSSLPRCQVLTSLRYQGFLLALRRVLGPCGLSGVAAFCNFGPCRSRVSGAARVWFLYRVSGARSRAGKVSVAIERDPFHEAS